MDMNRYCRHCGNKVEFEYGAMTTHCPTCNQTITRKDTLSGYTREARISQLQAMHNLMCNANDGNVYMSWIHTMPDEATMDDFIDIAINDDDYNECFDAFVRLIQKDGNRW